MQELIAPYLFQQKKCHLPGIGTLCIVHTVAVADFTNKIIKPPTAVVQFNNDQKDTPGFIQFLSKSKGCSPITATGLLEDFCSGLKKKMSETEKVNLHGIGVFELNSSGSINFLPEELPDVFLQPVAANRVIRPDAKHTILVGDTETTNTVMAELLAPQKTVKDLWWIWAIVLGVIGLIAILIYFSVFNGDGSFGNAIKI